MSQKVCRIIYGPDKENTSLSGMVLAKHLTKHIAGALHTLPTKKPTSSTKDIEIFRKGK